MSDLDEKIIKSEELYIGKLVHLYRDTVELPDGTHTPREIIRHPGAVAAVPLVDGDSGLHVILVRQYRTAAQKLLLEIPAGTLEPGEKPDAAMDRELQEEIGYRAGTLERLLGEYTAPGYTTELIHIYLATDLTPARLAGDADEFIEAVTLPFDEALGMVLRGDIEDGKTIIGLLLAARRLGR
jgi:ADP-ribose pyrophosphatase